jgi:hypothetical protein
VGRRRGRLNWFDRMKPLCIDEEEDPGEDDFEEEDWEEEEE